MPKVNLKFVINLDLLKPQSNSQKLPIKLFRWLLSTGRFIFVFVEALVLVAFIFRFKLDADIAAKKEAIEQQVPYIESLKPYEVLIKQTQLKLSTIGAFNQTLANYPEIFKKISDQTPAGVKLINLNLTKDVSKVNIQINAQAQNNYDLATFIQGLKQDSFFADVNLTSVGLEQGVIRFSLSANTKLSTKGEQIL